MKAMVWGQHFFCVHSWEGKENIICYRSNCKKITDTSCCTIKFEVTMKGRTSRRVENLTVCLG